MKNTAEQSLYNLLITQNLEPEILDSAGRPVTDPSKAELFSFDYVTENQDYGTVVILISDNKQLEVYFGDNLGRGMEADDKSSWYEFLHQLKSFASRNMMTFGLNNIARLKYTMQGMAAIKEGLFEGYYGKKNISYSDQPKQVRLMIKHNRNIGEGEARYRAIESLFVETAEGERFKLPFRNLMGGRIMARHVSEGGTPYDTFGQHIVETISEIGTLSRFIRATRGKKFTGNTDELVEIALRHYSDLKDKAKRMISHRGYLEERDMFDPAEISESSATTDTIRDLFIEQNVDQRIEEALPILAQLANKKEDKMREADEFESWANRVMEGTWALPDTPEADARLNKLMSKPLIVGADATNATEQLYDLVGDDVLFDRLNDLADRDPNSDCWEDPEVINRLGELGIDINSTVGPDSGEQDMTEGARQGIMLNGKEVDMRSLEIENVDSRDYPDFSDAYIGRASFTDGTDLSDQEMDQLNDEHGDLVNELAYDSLHESDLGEDLDTDGVMMTKSSNMSSESVERMRQLSGMDMSQQGVAEGMDHSPVASAITRRILIQRADLLSKYGPEKVTAAIDDVADFVGDTEEIGSSDVSGWVRQVEQSLGGVDEGILDAAKKVGSRVFDKLGGGTDQELLDKLRKDAGLPPRMAVPNKKDVGEDLDTDGVMMTRPSNMSS